MNLIQVSESQLMAIWVSCLAILYSPLPVEEKIKALETALMAKVLVTDQIIPIVQSGLVFFDEALINYASEVESRLKTFDIDGVNTGSRVFDQAFKDRIQRVIYTNFPEIKSEIIE